MSALLDYYLLSSEGVVVNKCRPKQLKSKIKLHFGNRLILY